MDYEGLAAVLMVSISIIFNLYITLPLMNNGVNDSGDDSYHVSQAFYLKKLILQDHTVMGVVTAHGASYPWFNSHQFLMYFTEATINILRGADTPH